MGKNIWLVILAIAASAVGCSSAPEKTEDTQSKAEPLLETILLDDNYAKKDAKKEAYRHYQAGEAYSWLGAAGLAFEEYWKAFELDKNTLYLNRLGVAALMMKRLGDARYFFEEAQRLEPDRIEHLANVAFIDFAQKRYESAEKKYRQVIARSPNSMMISYNLAYSILMVTLSGAAITAQESMESFKAKLSDAQRERLREARRLFENTESLPNSCEQMQMADEKQIKQNASFMRSRIDYLLDN